MHQSDGQKPLLQTGVLDARIHGILQKHEDLQNGHLILAASDVNKPVAGIPRGSANRSILPDPWPARRGRALPAQVEADESPPIRPAPSAERVSSRVMTDESGQASRATNCR